MVNSAVVGVTGVLFGTLLGASLNGRNGQVGSLLGPSQQALVAVGSSSSQCPPPAPCPRCQCPRCEQEAAPAPSEQDSPAEQQDPQASCPVCEAVAPPTHGSLLNSNSMESSEGHQVSHSPAPVPSGSYNSKNFYPLHNAYNRFEHWYNKRKTGKGVWKWTQYFPAWERHFAKFIAKSWAGEEVHMAELGIFSGGSLEMWQAVFGPGLRLWGVDIATITKQYEKDDTSGRTKIFNMDQTNSASWDEFKKKVPKLDILIDDGLHLFSGQKATFDNIVDHIAPGGVFMTEDISDGRRPGARPSKGDGSEYNEKYLDYSFQKTRGIHYENTKWQSMIDSVHYYPYLFVLEKREVPLAPHGRGPRLTAIKHGTLWKPISHGVVKGQHAN